MTDGALARILHDGQPWWAEIRDGKAVLLPDFRYGELPPHRESAALSLDMAHLLPPIEPDARIFCVGRNYRAHAAEMGGEAPAAPSLFQRLPESLVGPDAALDHPGISERYDYEGEIAIVLGSGGWRLTIDQAAAAIGGLTLVMDGSVRDYQSHSLLAGKNFRRSGAIGPWIVPAAGIDSATLALETRLNGRPVQQGCLADLIHGPAALVRYLSAIVELRAGDIISTGTPAGVGAGRSPPTWLRPGDRMEVTCPQIGTLCNIVRD